MAAMNTNNSSIHVKVLVVDDDWTSLSIVSSMLKKWSYEVVTVKSPVDAMATLRIQQNYFNLVVTDLHMPIMSGSELARQINLEFKSIPVILMSADDKESVIVECLASGAVYYIIKPINPEDLKNVWQYAAAAKKGKVQEIVEDVTLQDLEDIGDGYGSRRVSMISSDDDENTNTNTNVSVSLDSSNKRKICSKDEEDEGMSNNGGKAKKYKVVWTTVLHNLFLQAVRHIGLEKAVPKKILEFMAVPGLTRENVASHLQKYRLFLKRVAMRSSVPTRNILSEKTLRSSFAIGHPMLMMARNAQLNNMINNNNGQQQQQSLRLSTLGPPLFPAPRSLNNVPHYSLPHNNLQPPVFQANLGHSFGGRLTNTGANLLQLSHHRNYGGNNIGDTNNLGYSNVGTCCGHNGNSNIQNSVGINGGFNNNANGMSNVNAAFGNFGYANQLMGPNAANGFTGQTSSSAAVVNGNQFNTRIVPVEHLGGQRVLENANRASNGETGRSYSLDELISGTVSTNPTLNSNRVGDNIDVDALFPDHINNLPQQQDGGAKEAMNSNGSAHCYNNPQVNPQVNENVIFDELHDLIPMESANASWHTQSLAVQNQNQNQNQDCLEMVNSNFGSTTPYSHSYPYQNIGESSIAQNFTTCSQRGGSRDADLFAMIQNINNTSDANLNDQSWGDDDGLVQ